VLLLLLLEEGRGQRGGGSEGTDRCVIRLTVIGFAVARLVGNRGCVLGLVLVFFFFIVFFYCVRVSQNYYFLYVCVLFLSVKEKKYRLVDKPTKRCRGRKAIHVETICF
jgi:hypothetical protein